jgi:hypothetical protein
MLPSISFISAGKELKCFITIAHFDSKKEILNRMTNVGLNIKR